MEKRDRKLRFIHKNFVLFTENFKWNSLVMIYRFQIYEYSQLMDDSVEKEIACDVTLKIIDIILFNETSLNKPTVRFEIRRKKEKRFVSVKDWQIDDVFSSRIFLCISVFTANKKASRFGTISDN